MNKLLSANFSRLFKNKAFWILMGASFLWGTGMIAGRYLEILKAIQFGDFQSTDVYYHIDNLFFQYAPIIGLFCAVFTTLFLGSEYSDGTIRNKISIGHSRRSIYLSNFIVCSAAGLLIMASWILSMFTVGAALLGWFKNTEAAALLLSLLISVFMVTAITAVFVLLSMLIQNKATSAVIVILAFFGLLFLGSYIENRLAEPESYKTALSVTIEGQVELSEPQMNPNYVSGTQRKLFEFAEEFLPTGQAILISHQEMRNEGFMILYSLVLSLFITYIGITLFERKDLK